MTEILVYEPIGEGESTAKALIQALRNVGTNDPITIGIFSPGGSIFEAEAMYSALKRHKGKVTVRIDGLAASAASYLAMAGDEIVMAPGSHLMVHMPSVSGYMSATEADLRDIIDRFDIMTKQMVRVYATRSGQDEATVRKMMERETWLTAEQAAQQGFADRIDDELEVRMADLSLAKFQYRHVPVAVKAMSVPNGDKVCHPADAKRQEPEAKKTSITDEEVEQRRAVIARQKVRIRVRSYAAGPQMVA